MSSFQILLFQASPQSNALSFLLSRLFSLLLRACYTDGFPREDAFQQFFYTEDVIPVVLFFFSSIHFFLLYVVAAATTAAWLKLFYPFSRYPSSGIDSIMHYPITYVRTHLIAEAAWVELYNGLVHNNNNNKSLRCKQEYVRAIRKVIIRVTILWHVRSIYVCF